MDFNALGGSYQTGPVQQTKTAYDRNGNPVKVGSGQPVQQWKPGVTYAGEAYFEAPPPAESPMSGGGSGSRSVGVPSSVGGLLGTGDAYDPVTANQESQQNLDLTYQRELQKIKSDAAEKAFGSRLQAVNGLMGQYGTQAPVSRTSGPSAEAEKAARDAAFTRSKEQAGSTALSSVKALEDVFAGRGLTGSTLEHSALGGAIGTAAGNLNETSRDQAIADANQASHTADLEYTGGVQQRGQDLNRLQSVLSLLNVGLY